MQHTVEEEIHPQARERILAWLAGQAGAMQELLQTVVNIDSGSRNEAGVTAVAEALRARLHAAGIAVQFEPVPGYGVLQLGAGRQDTVPSGACSRLPASTTTRVSSRVHACASQTSSERRTATRS